MPSVRAMFLLNVVLRTNYPMGPILRIGRVKGKLRQAENPCEFKKENS